MKQRNEPAEVLIHQRHLRQLRWRRKTFFVHAALETWVARSRWWDTDERRHYFRLQTNRGVLEVYRIGDQWFVSRIAD